MTTKRAQAESSESSETETPVTTPAESQVRVSEWIASYANEVGYETANAFARTYGRDTDTPSNLTSALTAFRTRPA